jgi:methylated-DNA-[protein]-cysteine S-methyltransferase
VKSKIGELIVGSHEDRLCLMDYRYRRMRTAVDNRIRKILNADYKENSSPVIEHAVSQLNEYLKGERKDFDIPLMMAGTDFQKTVWNNLLKIPYGKTCSYIELADTIGDKKAVRAVASANGANAVSIIIPCHRVIGSDGSLTGYAGGLAVKKRLLKLEGVDI